ncbi:MAG: hypothetical protein IJS56_03760 [Bacilli bacterium]|nr:hypothetical protein [Bacilli bacterium]
MNVIVVNENKAILDQLDVDVIKKIEGQFEVSELLSKFVNLYFDKLIIDVTSIQNYTSNEVMEKFAHQVDVSRVILLLNDTPVVNSNDYLANLVKNGIYNFSRNLEGIKFLYNTPNTLANVEYILNQPKDSISYSTGTSSTATYLNDGKNTSVNLSTAGKKIIGLSNLTMHAGASTLTNMMVRQLNAAGIPSIGVEMNRQDLIYYRSDKLFSCMSRIELEKVLRENSDSAGIIIDLNDFPEADKYCNSIVYLVEPSFIRLTKCIRKNKNVFIERKNDKVVLNMSFVSDDEVYDFEIETGVKVFDNLPPLNDRDTNCGEVNELLKKLGFNI